MKAIAKHFPKSKETMKGHGQKVRRGLQSTKPKKPISNANTAPNNNKDLTIPTAKEHDIFIKVYLVEEEANNTGYTNQPGRFPKKSSKGNQYILVLSHPDSNTILQAAMKNRMSGEMIRVYQALIDCVHSAGMRQNGTY
jgi:hypothetical protein